MTEAHRTEDLVAELRSAANGCEGFDSEARLMMKAAAAIEALQNHIFNGQGIIRAMFSQPENETARAWAKEWAHTEINCG